jgi:hypothetical protein
MTCPFEYRFRNGCDPCFCRYGALLFSKENKALQFGQTAPLERPWQKNGMVAVVAALLGRKRRN